MLENKTLLYAHGFASSGQSGTVERLRKLLPATRILAPDLPVSACEALTLLQAIAEKEHPDVIVGSSMGGMLVEQLKGYDRVLVNPAFEMGSANKSTLLGRHEFRAPRKDGATEFRITKPIIEEFQTVASGNFLHASEEEEQQRVFGLFGVHDDLVHTQPLFAQHYRQAIPFDGGHFLNDSAIAHALIPVLRWIDNRQEQRQLPILYLGIDTLFDAHDQPRSSAVKAVEMLSEHYDIYALGAGERLMSLTAFGVPLWNRWIQVPRRSLLLGDYLLDTTKDEAFFGTSLLFGEPPFKTWEDALIYFDRLGGQ